MTIRYRKLDENGDYVFGSPPSVQQFYIDQPEAVAQAVLTRLRLSAGEWFLDADEGTPYTQAILGFAPANVRDFAIRQRVLDTIGINEITTFGSQVTDTRDYTVSIEAQSIFGPVVIDNTL